MKIQLSPNCFNIDQSNFIALTKGFVKDGERNYQSVWCDVKPRKYPALFTMQRGNVRNEYSLSKIGEVLNNISQPIEYKYIADIIEEYFIENIFELWERLCTNGIFDIWLPESPYKRFKYAKTPPSQYRIVLLRVYEIKEIFNSSDLILGKYSEKIKDAKKLLVTIKRPLINDKNFNEIKETLENTLAEFKFYSKNQNSNSANALVEISKNEEKKSFAKPIIKHLKINNFKILNLETNIIFSTISVIIGPNNSGKTTVLQAIVLWQRCIRSWYEEQQNGKISNYSSGIGINKYDLTATLVNDVRLLWKDTIIKNGSSNTLITITIGLFYKEQMHDCTVNLRFENKEMIFAYLSENVTRNKELISAIAKLKVKILYPISKISEQEDQFTEQTVLAKVEAGYTNEILMNLCYFLWERNKTLSIIDNKWHLIHEIMKKMFGIDMDIPKHYPYGKVSLSFKPVNSDVSLPISMAGTGQQQMLALLAFFGYQENGTILYDEPDAHFESLRQRQVFNLLKYLAEKNNNQLIISTHSEVIINDSADFDINLMLGGDVFKLTDSAKQIKFFIRDFGIEHYYKAKLTKSVLYVEGSTDISMLRKFAEKLSHNAKDILDGDFYYYYTRDNKDELNIDKILQSPESSQIINYHSHFQNLQMVVQGFAAVGIFDRDNSNKQDYLSDSKNIVFWKKYELENYFVSVQSLKLFVLNEFNHFNINTLTVAFNSSLNSTLSDFLFNSEMYSLYQMLPENQKTVLFRDNLERKKGSAFLDYFFSQLHTKLGESINKGEYYKIIPFAQLNEEEENEIIEKLDLIATKIKCTQQTI